MNAHFQGKTTNARRRTKTGALLVERPCDDLISSPNVNDPPSLLIDNNADDLRNNTTHEKQNNREFILVLPVLPLDPCGTPYLNSP
ncbi:hypothetical protein H5410_051915 [Solanum commersonii]|uniref:Uncharacterized protein n=1 Tax=Solanum commersonii TaxID=4109 RepID=A0A9J5X2G9_SOLCO|nr:hypothetical protein H5410_051915 [Solanum commersonii]